MGDESEQYDLDFEQGYPSVRSTDPETSREAWGDSAKDRATARAYQVLSTIIKSGEAGCTCKQIGYTLGLDRDSVSPRIPILVKLQMIFTNGKRGRERVWKSTRFRGE